MNTWLPEETTVGTTTDIMYMFRATDGSALRSSAARTVPIDAFVVSRSGACPLTVIVSCRPPTSSSTSTVMNCCVATRRPVRS
ncbi:MAG: hypothetical protein ABS36_12335 [Acidobacteria bacterium SCN 69-37]|nr:MAG: hypothetical protein ABS36_12335 [Acidobacteria bacterium SCN 69-37]